MPSKQQSLQQSFIPRVSLDFLVTLFGIALFAGIYVRNFYSLGDLWLLARVSEHFYAGHGLVWNYGERIWVATSALWQLLLIATHGITGGAEPYIQALILHSIIAAAFLAVVYWRWGRGRYFVLTVLLLISSNLVMDYTSAGMENGLIHLLIAGLWAAIMRGVQLRWIALLFGVSLLARHDVLLIIAPAMVFLWVKYAYEERAWCNNKRAIVELALSAVFAVLPIAFLTGFAWLYYGDPIPNSARVLDRTFGPLWDDYWLAFLNMNSIDAMLLLIGISMVFWKITTVEKLLALGIILYIIYMSVSIAPTGLFVGRQASWCVVLSILLLTNRFANASGPTIAKACVAVVAIMVVYGYVMGLHTPLFASYSHWGIEKNQEVIHYQLYNGYMDSRLNSPLTALPNMMQNKFSYAPVIPLDLNLARAAWDRREVYVPGRSSWIIAYYTPLKLVVADNFHHRTFRNGDFNGDFVIDAP